MKKYMIFSSILILLISVVFYLFLNKSETIPFHEILSDSVYYRGGMNYSNSDVYEVIKNKEDLNKLGFGENYNIDFHQYAIVFLTRGFRGNGVYDIDLKEVKKKDDILFIYVEKSDPGNIISPMTNFVYKLYTIDRRDIKGIKKIKFIEKTNTN